jgi:GTP-binding protein
MKKMVASLRNNQTFKEKENVSLLLIDLPGYGFAYTSDERMNEWKDLMQHFLVERGHMLKRILLLVDARHGFKKADFDFLDTLQQSLVSSSDTYYTNGGSSLDERVTEKSKRRVEIKSLPPIQVVLTKCDLVQQKDLARRVVQVKRQLSDSLVRESKGALPVMLVSAKAGLGYNNIRGSRARGGILELQRELASIAPRPKLIMNMIKTKKPIAPVVNKQIKRR